MAGNRSWRWWSVATLAVAVLGVAALQAQESQSRGAPGEDSAQTQNQPEPRDQTMPSTSDKTPASEAVAAQEQGFSGKIVKSKDGVALKDATNHTTYKLDDDKRARQFVGKDVTVTGTLDQTTRTIHVSNIEASPAH